MDKTKQQKGRGPGNPMGPSSGVVAGNLRKVRLNRGLTLQDVAERLTERGRTMTTSAVSKIERAERRVDVDDLTALAAVLGVTPTDLLMPVATDGPLLTGLPEGLTVEDVDAWLLGKAELTREALADYWLHEADRTRMFMAADVRAYKAAQAKDEKDRYLERVQMQQSTVARDRDRAVEHLRAAGVLEPGQGYDDIPGDYLPQVIDLTELGVTDA